MRVEELMSKLREFSLETEILVIWQRSDSGVVTQGFGEEDITYDDSLGYVMIDMGE
jgi:hypothetical protein